MTDYSPEKFAWPATEVPTAPPPLKRSRQLSGAKRRQLAVLAEARRLARRWEAGDEEVMMRDIIDVLLRRDRHDR